MAVVAFVALAVGGFQEFKRLGQLSENYSRRAIMFARRATPYQRNMGRTHAEWEAKAAVIRKQNEGAWMKFSVGPSPERSRKLWPYFHSLRQKYERAARYPWLPVEPDPPEPE
jgi:hypothetical protein